MNIELLKQVKKRILRDAESFDMDIWLTMDSCGTVGCIAGHVCMMVNKTEGHVFTIARSLLGLSENEAVRLFLPNYGNEGWPYEWRRRLDATTPGTKEHAQVVAEYIDFFTDGATKDEPRKPRRKKPKLIPQADLIPIDITVRRPEPAPALQKEAPTDEPHRTR